MKYNIVYGKGMWKQQKEENNKAFNENFNNNKPFIKADQSKNDKIKVACEDCGQEFILNDIREKYIGSMLTAKYFVCPRCGKEYVIGIYDNKSRQLGREAYELYKAGKEGLSALKITERKQHLQKLINTGVR